MVSAPMRISNVVVHPPTTVLPGANTKTFTRSYSTTSVPALSLSTGAQTARERRVGNADLKVGLSGMAASCNTNAVPRIMQNAFAASQVSTLYTTTSTSVHPSAPTVASTEQPRTMGMRPAEFLRMADSSAYPGAQTHRYPASSVSTSSTLYSPQIETRSSGPCTPYSLRRERAPIDVPCASAAKPRSPESKPCGQPCSGQSKRHRTSFSQGTESTQLRGVEVCTLDMGGCSFDPTRPVIRSQLNRALGISESAHIEAMQGPHGGLNEGVWFAPRSQGGEFVLKLVKGVSSHPAVPTEAENVLRISKLHPDIVQDCDLAFPLKVVRLQGCPGGKPYDLIVMRKAAGVQLQQVILKKLHSGRQSELFAIFETVGACLARFHCRYGNKQHCDLNLANILYDECSGRVVLIDAGGMGDPQVHAKDAEHFPKSIKLVTEHQNSSIGNQLVHHFQLGYTRTAGAM